jgi:RHS repeat-associated protein
MFAGMERDTETGNDHTWFRGYEQNLGRWMSPDLLGGDITNPQSLNRYAYALNNPTTLIDPVGLQSPGDNCSSKTGASLIDCVTGIYCMADPGQCSNRLLFGLMGNLDPFDSMGMHMWVSDEEVQSTIYYDGSEIGGGQTDTESLNFIVSQGGQQQSGTLSQLGASISSAYGTALGTLGQVFRGRPPGMSYSACMAQNAGLMGASAVAAMVGLGSYLTPASIGGVTVNLPASYISLARGIAAVGDAVGVPGSEAGAGYVLGAAAGLSNAGAVLGSAGFGWLVGSAANCASEGVNP